MNLSYDDKKSVKRQQTIKEKIIYYCSNCQCECMPMKKPIVENKITDIIEVCFK